MIEKSLTYSSIQMFKACRKKYQYKYVMGLVPVEKPLYFSTGAAFHVALESHYKGQKPDQSISLIENYFNENMPGSDDLERFEKWDSEKRLTVALFCRYLEYYQMGEFWVIDTEKQFNVPIINPETGRAGMVFDIAGKIDLLVKVNGLYWIVEHKTAGVINSLYKKKLTMDAQSILYIEAMGRSLNIKIQGVIYNVILKAVPKKPGLLKAGGLSTSRSQCTTLELFKKSISENFLDESDYTEYLDFLSRNRKEYFYREYLTFTPEDMAEWRRELWDIQQDIRKCENENRYYKNTNQCTNYGVCGYFDICSAIDRESVIESSFKKLEAVNEELETESHVEVF
jgi:hypothetical protein